MDSGFVEGLGIVAGLFTTGAYLPQVLKTWRSRAVADISLAMYGAMAAGLSLWLAYGLLLRAPAVVLANAVSLLLVLWMLSMKLRYGRSPRDGEGDGDRDDDRD